MAKNQNARYTAEDKGVIAKNTNRKAARLLGRTPQAISCVRTRCALGRSPGRDPRRIAKKAIIPKHGDKGINIMLDIAHSIKAMEFAGIKLITMYPDGRLVGIFE